MKTVAEIATRIADRFPPGRWQRGYIVGKIRSDPVYGAVADALGGRALPLWDGGCGLGLLAFYLRECGWDGDVLGTDLSGKKIARGNAVAAAHYPGVHLAVGSIAEPPRNFRGTVTLLDVLHYLEYPAQEKLLARARQMVAPGGVCLIRFTARDRSWRYRVTFLEELLIRGIGWIRGGRICFPTVDQVREGFDAEGWSVELRPLWGRTPFNSYLLMARPPEIPLPVVGGLAAFAPGAARPSGESA